MLATNHVLAGALIGTMTDSPLAAFTAGVASHFALDAVPHWGCEEGDDDTFLKVARADGLTLLGVLGILAVAAPRERRLSVLAGALGGLAPDVNKPCVHFFGFSPFPASVDRFHASIQRESTDRMPQEFAVGSGLAVALAGRLRRLRRP